MLSPFIVRGVRLVVLALTVVTLTQTPAAQGQPGAGAAPPKSSDTDQRPYNKRDFNGYWSRGPATYGMGDCPECRDTLPIPIPGYGYFGDVPPRTPEGERRLQLTKHGRGYEPDSEGAKKFPNLDPAYKRAGLPAFSNDPEARCEPLGLARNLTMTRGGPGAFEMVQSKDRILEVFECVWDFRSIWMDGRSLDQVTELAPRFNGYSVGRWEGDTLVVTSTGFDDRQWLDMYGFPVSEKAVLVERWERPSPNRLRLQMTLTDPVNYTRPWTSSVKTWAAVPRQRMALDGSPNGWADLLEDKCVPADEALFNTFRDHAAGEKKAGENK
jgi:hypothetical protein